MMEKVFKIIPDGIALFLYSDHQHKLSFGGRNTAEHAPQRQLYGQHCYGKIFGLRGNELLYLLRFDSLEYFKQELRTI